MNILESVLSLIAPHVCVACGYTGSVLCQPCALCLPRYPSRCYRCRKATLQSKVCVDCRRKTGISRVWTASPYEETAKKLVYKMKFERAKTAGSEIAKILDRLLPILPEGVVVTHLPTANARIRMRGYDQAQVIARNLAKNRRLRYKQLLSRSGSARQVGASRQDRFKQLDGIFSAKGETPPHVLLIDDVLTTGASIESAAKELRHSGAQTVEAAVFTQP